MSIERDDSAQNQCLLRKSRGRANTVSKHVCVPVYVMDEISTQACDVAYFLPVQSHCKFSSKWLLSCTFSNGGVTPYLFLAVIKEHANLILAQKLRPGHFHKWFVC